MTTGREHVHHRSIRRTLRNGLGTGVVMAAALCVLGCDGNENTYVAPPPLKVIVTKPTIETVEENLSFTGNTAAIETVKLVARVEGYLKKIHFDDGQRVKKNDLLFTIQQDQYRADVLSVQGEIDAIKAQLKHAETEYQRYLGLYKQKAAAATEVDRWLYNRDSAQAELESAQAKLENANLSLGYTTVTAPFDGRMGRHLIDAGNLVGTDGETLLAEINRIDPIYVYFTINERDLLRVTQGEQGASGQSPSRQNTQVLYMGLSSQDGYPYKGKLDFAAITVNPQTGTLQLRGIFPNPDGKIVPGLFARVRAPYTQVHNAVLVPAQAVGFDQQGNYVLTVNDKNIVERRTVETGEQIGEKQIITSGLNGDERLIVEGLLRAIPGHEVAPEWASDSPPASPTPTSKAG
jgi:RND family efflux transporter, MFP subunit